MSESELDAAYRNLTVEQQSAIKHLRRSSHTISGIACCLGLTRSYVHSYIRKLNSEAQ